MKSVLKPFNAAQKLLKDENLSKDERLRQWVKIMTTEVTVEIPSYYDGYIESDLRQIHHKMVGCQFQSSEDGPPVTKEEVQEMMLTATVFTWRIIMDICNRMVMELDYFSGYDLVDTIQTIREYHEITTQILGRTIQWKAHRVRQGCNDAGKSPFHILRLLVQFNTEEAMDAIIDVVELPDSVLEKLFGARFAEILAEELRFVPACSVKMERYIHCLNN